MAFRYLTLSTRTNVLFTNNDPTGESLPPIGLLEKRIVKHFQGRGLHVSEDINVLALVKGEEKYIFLFDDDKRAETLRTLGRYASDSDLSFSWYDAAVLSQKIRAKTEAPEPVRFDMPIPDGFGGEDISF